MTSGAPNSRPIRLVVGPLETNCYLVPAGDATLVIDPADEAQRIIRACEATAGVLAILLTHGHPDHVAAAAEVARATGAGIYAHPADAQWLDGSLDVWGVRNEPLEFSPAEEAVRLVEGLTVLHTPGHTPGSVCYLLGRWAFVGDTLFAGSVGRTDLVGGSYGQLLGSLRLLASALAPDTRIFPGHGPPTTMSKEMASNAWLQEALAGQ